VQSTSVSGQRSETALSPSEFALIKPVFKASVPLDSGRQPSWIRSVDLACLKVRARDSLLASFRRLCRMQVRADEIQEEDQQCDESAGVLNASSAGQELKAGRLTTSCQANSLDALAAANVVLAARSQQFNQIVNRTVDSRQCRQVLDTPRADLAYYSKVSVAMRQLASATRRGAKIAMQRSSATWGRLNNDTTFQTNHVQLTELERNCE
jgi:hypothetical protein